MATGSRRVTAQRSGIALAALLVASMSAQDHRIAAALQQGVSATGSATGGAVGNQPAHLVKASFGTISPAIAHHYP